MAAGSECVQNECPAGKYGNAVGLTTAECSGSAREGYYTPAGSQNATAVACPAGTFNPNLGGGYNSSCTPCPMGSYCEEAAVAPIFFARVKR